MAQTWLAKAPTEVVQRRWTVPLADGDGIATIATSATGVTVSDTEEDGANAVITLSAGTAGVGASVTVTVVSDDGLTFVETFLIAIRATAATSSNTARDAVNFALRKVVGVGETATASEADDALEQLNDMLAMWRIDGLDIGVAAPLILGDSLDLADEYLAAVKFNLRIACHALYGTENTLYDVQMAEEGKRLIANRLLSLGDLSFSGTLTRRYAAELD